MESTATAAPAAQTTNSQNAESKTGLFLANYQIGGGIPGGVTANLHLLVNTVSHQVTGYGDISQAIMPPPDFDTHLTGSYSILTLPPAPEQIVVTAIGYPVLQWPPHGGIGPVLMPNARLHMLLSKDWKTGTATFDYFENGKWNELKNAPVKLLN